ncbi:ParB/RepB/Spo0J family partition protein [Dactylosporangium sp. NPDC048998]|uniref:ParB/RepB/Spo0J family partition protein n=1 Tax=Dactylosporangium sp. NPDC048998 TaxID=3363976 RepID=UPI003721202A
MVLRGAVSPRSEGVDENHARLLAESALELPPVVVQRSTMRVIDGMHRIRAAILLGRSHIAATLVDDDDDAAFLRAIAANIAHGLPLSLADRRTAAAQVIKMNPDWSDRRVARAVGLSDKTVGKLRRHHGLTEQSSVRVGQDGRARPVDGARGRKAAGELLALHPEASVRQIAAAAGVSRATARDVRDRIRQGQDPARPTQRPAGAARSVLEPPSVEDVDLGLELGSLSRDPSLRYSEIGKALLRTLHVHALSQITDHGVAALPPHSLPAIARIAQQYSARWKRLAELADRRARAEAA